MNHDLSTKWTNARFAARDVEGVIHDIREQLENGVVPKSTLKNLRAKVRALEYQIKAYGDAKKRAEQDS